MAQAKFEVFSSITIDAAASKIIIEASEEAARKANLPISEAGFLQGPDAQGAHGDEIVEPSAAELGAWLIARYAAEHRTKPTRFRAHALANPV